MFSDNNLFDAVARFTNSDMEKFRQEWNAQSTSEPKSLEKQQVFQQAQKHVQGKNLLVGGISARVRMKYQSLSGELKERDVVIRRIFKSGKEVFIDLLCLDLNAPRLVKMDNILQIIDGTTLYTHPQLFFEEVLGVPKLDRSEKKEIAPQPKSIPSGYTLPSAMKGGELKTAIERTRHEINALLFVSGMDGNRDPKELQTIVDYVRQRCPDLTFTDADLLHYLTLNYPDVQSFYFSLERILGKEGWVVRMFLEKLMALVVADGHIDDKEKLFLADFLRILEEEGFELDFKTA